MMLKAEPNEVVNVRVRRISIDMSNLAITFFQYSVEMEAETAMTTALYQNFSQDRFWYAFPLRHPIAQMRRATLGR
jgi:hypothetical protein